eukprot:3651452-Pyramimonas_sp.AAC.3
MAATGVLGLFYSWVRDGCTGSLGLWYVCAMALVLGLWRGMGVRRMYWAYGVRDGCTGAVVWVRDGCIEDVVWVRDGCTGVLGLGSVWVRDGRLGVDWDCGIGVWVHDGRVLRLLWSGGMGLWGMHDGCTAATVGMGVWDYGCAMGVLGLW